MLDRFLYSEIVLLQLEARSQYSAWHIICAPYQIMLYNLGFFVVFFLLLSGDFVDYKKVSLFNSLSWRLVSCYCNRVFQLKQCRLIGPDNYLFGKAVLFIVVLAAPLASTHQMPIGHLHQLSQAKMSPSIAECFLGDRIISIKSQYYK